MDSALHVTQVRSGPAVRSQQVLPWSYRFFGSALVGRAPQQLPLGVRATLLWALAEAARYVHAGRARPDEEEVLGLRLAYQALKAEAAIVRAAADSPGEMLGAAIALRHRQRAAVLMRLGLKMSESDVARVLGVRPAQVQPIIAGARAAVARRLGRPVNLARVMRAAATPVPEAAPPAEGSVAKVVRLPRPSPVQVLIAPDLPAATEPQPAPTVSGVPANIGRRRSVWSLIGRVAAAATVGMLFAWAIWPVH